MQDSGFDIAERSLEWSLLQHLTVELITILYSIFVWGLSHNDSKCAACFKSTLKPKLVSTFEGRQVLEYLLDRDNEWGGLLNTKGADLEDWIKNRDDKFDNVAANCRGSL